MSDIHWIEYIKAFGPALIALFVAYIAYHQWQVNRATLREKLFDRRFDIFKSVHRFLSAILRDAKVSDDSLPEYFDAIQKSRFLFGTEIQEYLKLINSRAQDMRLFQIKLKDLPVGQERSELCEKESDELKWLTNQIEEIFNRFEPYLGFERHQ